MMTLLVNSKTHEKVVLHMTFEGAIGQVRSPMKPTRVALGIGCCRINQQSRNDDAVCVLASLLHHLRWRFPCGEALHLGYGQGG
jgi:hypothetical protein